MSGSGYTEEWLRNYQAKRGLKRMTKTISELDFMVPNCKTVSEMNQREHWRVRKERKKDQQEAVAVAMNNALRGRRVELPCIVKLTRIGPRKMDNDNLAGAMKHCPRDYSVKVEIESARPGVMEKTA